MTILILLIFLLATTSFLFLCIALRCKKRADEFYFFTRNSLIPIKTIVAFDKSTYRGCIRCLKQMEKAHTLKECIESMEK